MLFDFTTEAGRRGWSAAHDLAPLEGSREGLIFTITGGDPYAFGPPVELKEAGPLWLVLRLRAAESGMGQVFYFQDGGPTEPGSVRFPVRAGRWEEVRVALPALAPGTWRFRLDPPGTTPGSRVSVAFLNIEKRVALKEPAWPAPGEPGALDVAGRVMAGGLALELGRDPFQLVVRFGGSLLARGHDGALIGWQESPGSDPLFERPKASSTHTVEGRGGLRVATTWTDAGGAHWTYSLLAQPAPGDSIALTVSLSADRARTLVHFPALVLLAEAKNRRGLFAGVEYLDPPDSSSSEADLRGPQALRHVPDAHVPTLPLMAIQGEGRYLSLEWSLDGDGAACFDSPARILGATRGHLLGMLFPDGSRPPDSRLPHAGRALKPGEALTQKLTLRAGRGEGVGEAISAHIEATSLPKVPKLPGGWETTLASGWLDSGIHEQGRWRHAFPGEFPLSGAADALACQSWLAARLASSDPLLATRLRRSAEEGRRRVVAEDTGGIGHVRQSAAALLPGGDLAKAARSARERVRGLLSRLTPDGTVIYEKSPARPDFGATHFEKTANGLSAEPLVEALRALTLAPDTRLIGEAVARLRQLDFRWKSAAPRGAQTWEVPLHTPDILASAHLAAASVLAYELTGDKELLESARRWAFSGVPFVYLREVARPVGAYATIAVLGATNWEAPNWIGLPVQWCGLVFADALLDLAEHDERGPWKKLAEGICASGALQTWPRGEGQGRGGLLPDSFHLPAQVRNDVCINPATLQVPLARSLGVPLYTRRVLSFGGPFVHAPGVVEARSLRSFTVRGWPEGEYTVLICGLTVEPRELLINKKPTASRFDSSVGSLALTLTGRADVSWR